MQKSMRDSILSQTKPVRTVYPEVYVYNFSDITLEMLSLAYEMGKKIEVSYDNSLIFITR